MICSIADPEPEPESDEEVPVLRTRWAKNNRLITWITSVLFRNEKWASLISKTRAVVIKKLTLNHCNDEWINPRPSILTSQMTS